MTIPVKCWECVKDRHGACNGRDDPPPAGTAGRCACPDVVHLAAFIRARLEDLAADAGAYHSDGARMPFPPPRCAGLDYRGPCDCGEPNRRRRRAFTHSNLVDWAEAAATAVGTMTVDDTGHDHDPVDVLRHLAAEWTDHPDYLTEWAP